MPQYRRCSDCSHCALDGKRIVYGQMPEAAGNGIVLLGEAPGAAEEAEGVPFTGPSGRLLNWALKCSGIDRHKCWATNSILCRPPTNDIGGFEGESAKKACKVGLDAELRAAKQGGCRVIVALGETALRSLNIQGSPSSLRGSVLDGTGAASGFFVIPTYHPAYLYRNNWTRVAGGSASHTAVWLSDLEKAREVARPGWKRPAERFITHPTITDLEALWQRVQREPDLVLGVDIETTSLDPRYGEIVVIGFSTSEEDAICVPLLKAGPVGSDGRRHGIPYWPNGSATRARYYLEKILTSAKQMYQNGFFDIPYLRYHGFSVPDGLYTFDSMLLHAIVSPETEHNLGFITSVYGKTPYWKDEFKNRAGGIFDMDETRMRAYNCRDCVTLQQIVPAMLRHMGDLNLLRVWDEEVHPMVRPIMIMKEKGVLFNKSRMTSFQEKMIKRLQEKALELRELGSLPEAFNISSDDEVRLFLFGVRPSKAVQLTSWVFTGQEPCKPTKAEPERTHRSAEKTITGIIDEKAARRDLPEGFIVESARKVPTLEVKKKGTAIYEDLLKLDTILRETSPLYIVPGYNGPKTDGGKFATNKDGLLSLRIVAQNRLDYLDALKTPREDEVTRCTDLLVWLEAFADYSAAEKLITAFTRYRTSSDGRIHPNWQIHGTSTGRLSCIAGGTLIPTERGSIPIESVIIGDKVITHTGKRSEVTRVIYQGRKEVGFLAIHGGQFITCTPDHKFYSKDGWVRADKANEVYFDEGSILWGLTQGKVGDFNPHLRKVRYFGPIGSAPVFDLTVRGDHSYVAGGFLAKNCTDPNLMQLPSGKVRKEDKEIRRFFYAPEGWSMVSSDFSSAEVGLLAFELDDEAMIRDYEAGISPHAANVKILFGFDKGHPFFEEAKLGAKKFQFGGLSYGGGDRFVFRQITKECTHIKLSFADYQKGKAAWMALHPKYEAWRTALEAEVLEKRIIYNEFGRARIFLDNDKDIIKEAMNFKIQSAGASILNRVIARIQARIDAHHPALKGYPIMQIHDQLVYECPDDEIEVFKTFITEEMTRPFMYKGHPRSLRIELSTGKTFGDLD